MKDGPEFNSPFYCPWLTGAYWVVRKKCWDDVGGFDERFFFSCEDHAFCLDAWEKDWKILYDPRLIAIHQEGGVEKTQGNLDREKINLERIKSQRLFTKETEKRDLNDTFRKVWEENKKIIGDDPKKPNILLIERTGAIGDVILLTGLLESIHEKYPDWLLCVRTNCPYVFRDNPNVHIAGESISHAMARVITLNMAYEKRPAMSIAEAYKAEFKEQGIDCEIKNPQIFSNEMDWNVILARHKGKIDASMKYIVVHPSQTHWRNRKMPRIFWMEIVHGIKEMGILPIIVGTEADTMPPMDSVLDFRGPGNITFQELHQLIKHAKLFIGSDSMVVHMCQATETPGIGIFTIARPELRLISKNVRGVYPMKGCRFCYEERKEATSYYECPRNKDYECTKNIEAKEVLGFMADILRAEEKK
jgi:ADP-heptose:LPS heptosyltransferase